MEFKRWSIPIFKRAWQKSNVDPCVKIFAKRGIVPISYPQMTRREFVLLLLIIFLAALSRIVLHIPNFSPLTAIALFAAAHFTDKRFAILIPIVATWLSDLSLNFGVYANYPHTFIWFYPGFYWQYGAYILIALAGIWIFNRGVNPLKMVGGALAGSTIFYGVSNFGVWIGSGMYPHTLAGLVQCFVKAIPFYRGTLAGDMVYTIIVFGGFYAASWVNQRLGGRATESIS